jgi:hypothetical protein
MVDMNEHTMMFTLNGEILLDDSGSELAFKDFDVGDGKSHGVLSFGFADNAWPGPIVVLG